MIKDLIVLVIFVNGNSHLVIHLFINEISQQSTLIAPAGSRFMYLIVRPNSNVI